MTPRAAQREARAGFTLMEVLIAGTVFVIGILGVTYMQGASVRSNQDAYESMVATNFARQWLERIRRDSLSWTAPGVPTPGAMFATRPAGSASYFVPVVPGPAPAPAPLDTGLRPLDLSESTGANYHGIEVGQIDPMVMVTPPALPVAVANQDIYYCAFARFVAAANDRNGQLSTMTATVAVWWNRKASLEATSYAEIQRARQAGCDGAQLNFDLFSDPVPTQIRRVRLETAVRWTPP
jgi:type II secretory pathway pseudopilin PulG